MANNAKAAKSGRAFVELFTDNTKLVKGLRAAANRVKAFGAKIRNIGLGLTAAMAPAVAGIVGSLKHFSSYGDEVAKMAKRTGVAVSTLSELQYVASQTGTNFATLENALRKMQRSIYDAGRGLSTQVEALSDLGLVFRDLDGLSPEQQFKLLADRISGVSDPTRKAAIAMSLFGRTGTNLLPMFERGSAGIEKLQQKARDLGLTMSGADAAAAEDFTDAMDTMWKSVKMGVFQIGSALAPAIKAMSEHITRIVVKMRQWVDQNRGLIVSAAKVVAIVMGVGLSLTALGTAINLAGSAMLVLVGVLNKVLVAIGLLKTALIALATPVGLVIAALGALGVYLVQVSDAGGRALDWLGQKFKALKDEAYQSYDGIADALATGDIAQAAKILWLSLKLQWQKGIGVLKSMVEEMRFGIVAIYTNMAADITKVWLNMWAGLQKGSNAFIAQWKGEQELAGNWMAKRRLDFLESTGQLTKEDADFQRKQTDQHSNKRYKDIYGQKQSKTTKIDAELEKDLAKVDSDHKKRLEELNSENVDRKSEIEDELAKARSEWQEAIKTARANRNGTTDTSGPGDLSVRAPKLPDTSELIAQLKTSVTGTFNASAVSGLGTSSAADRTAKAAEESAKLLKRIETDLRDNGLAFS